MKKVYGCPAKAVKEGKYHPIAEYVRQLEVIKNKLNPSTASKFHKLSVKLDRALPRGLREKGNPNLSTTCILLELMSDEANNMVGKE